VTQHPFAITLDVGSGRANHTGSWRTERPVYLDLTPPCGPACPAGEDVRGWLFDAEDGSYERAWRRLVEVNPFPAIMGRVCYAPCQTACNRADLDEAVGINSVERFLGDLALEQGWALPEAGPPTGCSVLVIGAGPAGLSAAYQLRRLGHEVTVVDAGEQPGGMMRYGIPAYRLPRDVLQAEVQRVLDLGIDLRLPHVVADVGAELALGGHDACVLAVGAPLGKRVDIPAGDASRVLDAVTVLHDVADGHPPVLGRRVVVYGGGNTALDTARTARRLGATESLVVYRRDQARMPAHPEELRDALAEGVEVRWLSTVTATGNGTVQVERMELDDSGWPCPTGEVEELPADALLLAVGQDVDRSLFQSVVGARIDDGVLAVDATLMTGHPGVFAAGDVAAAERTVTRGIGQGRQVASSVDAWLRETAPTELTAAPVVPLSAMNTWYYSDAPRTVRPVLESARRATSFDEVVGGLDATTALFEARRCLSCGSCFECDNCFGVCPDSAVVKLGEGLRYEIDLDYCKGCGICASECPCGAIAMVPEPEAQDV
jgi:2-oxoacid:acceptor oxidoreductase delta subunit (pyruvate/2-ketoisovalerate family)